MRCPRSPFCPTALRHRACQRFDYATDMFFLFVQGRRMAGQKRNASSQNSNGSQSNQKSKKMKPSKPGQPRPPGATDVLSFCYPNSNTFGRLQWKDSDNVRPLLATTERFRDIPCRCFPSSKARVRDRRKIASVYQSTQLGTILRRTLGSSMERYFPKTRLQSDNVQT